MSFFSLLNLKHPAFVTLHLHGPDRTTVPRACSTGLPLLQRLQTGPQSHVLQVCPCFRESRQDHSPQGMFYRSDPFRESRQDHSPMSYRSAPLQRIQTGPQSPEHVLQVCPCFREAKTQQWSLEATRQEQLRQHEDPPEDQNLHPNHHTDHLRTLLKTRTFTQTITLTI